MGSLLYVEEAHPAQFGKFGLMCVKHEHTRIIIGKLHDAPLALTEHDGVRKLIKIKVRACAKELEETGMNVKRIDQVKFQHVDEIYPD